MDYSKSKLYLKAPKGQIVSLSFLNAKDKADLINAALKARDNVKNSIFRATPRVDVINWDRINEGLEKKGIIHKDEPLLVQCILGGFNQFYFTLQTHAKKEATV